MKRGLLCFIFFLVNWYNFAETEYFCSNSMGMLIEKIQPYRKDEHQYIVERTREQDTEIRILFNAGIMANKWEIEYYADQAVKSEKEYKEAELQKVYLYNARRLLEEEQFYTDGTLSRKILYFYEGKNTLVYAKAYDAAGNWLYQDDYFLAQNGRLREVKRTWNDNRIEKAAFIQGRGKIVQETQADADRTIVSRFDANNRLVIRENWNGENLLERQEYTYYADTNTVNIIKEENIASGHIYLKTYDKDGHLNTEIVEKDKVRIADIQYAWDNNGNKTGEREKSADGLTTRKYYYNAANALTSEEQYKRGSLELKTVYLENEEYYKEYYNQKGEAVIRAYYREDVKFKEEILDQGKVINTREVQ